MLWPFSELLRLVGIGGQPTGKALSAYEEAKAQAKMSAATAQRMSEAEFNARLYQAFRKNGERMKNG